MIGELLYTPRGVPERLFGVDGIEVSGDEVRGSMRAERWMRLDDGRPAGGLFGVPLDALIGQATLIARPDGMWPVTTELSIDVVAAPALGSTVAVHGHLVAADAATALAQGTAVAADGTTLATATTRTRYTPGVPDLDAAAGVDASAVMAAASAQTSLRAVFGAVPDEGGRRWSVPPGPAVLNAAGHVHGGAIVALADVVASAAVSGGDPLVTAGLRLTYLRPGSADGPIEIEAEVLHRGRTTSVVRVDVRGADGRLCAAGTVTALPG